MQAAINERRRDRTWVIGRVPHKYDRMLVSLERTQVVCLPCPTTATRSLCRAKLVMIQWQFLNRSLLQSREIPWRNVFSTSATSRTTPKSPAIMCARMHFTFQHFALLRRSFRLDARESLIDEFASSPPLSVEGPIRPSSFPMHTLLDPPEWSILEVARPPSSKDPKNLNQQTRG